MEIHLNNRSLLQHSNKQQQQNDRNIYERTNMIFVSACAHQFHWNCFCNCKYVGDSEN